MKNLKLFLSIVFIALAALQLYAQETSNDFFVGKWDVLVEGTPNGDTEMILTLKRVDDKLTGEIAREEAPVSEITNIEEENGSITIYFNSNGYDVFIYLEKDDKGEVEGTLMDLFDVTAKRIVEKK